MVPIPLRRRTAAGPVAGSLPRPRRRRLVAPTLLRQSITRWTSATSLVCALFFVSGLGQTAIVPLLPRMSAVDGLSAAAAALVLALPGLAMLTVSVPAGLLADRYGARRVTLCAGALMVIGCTGQALPGFAVLLGGRIAYGIAFGILWTAGAAWLAQLSDASAGGCSGAPSRAGTSVGQAVVCSSVGTMVGPALGGLLGAGSSAAAPFAAIALVGALVSVVLARAPAPAPAAAPARPRPRRSKGSPAWSRGELPTVRRRAVAAGASLRDPWIAGGIGSLVVAGALSGVTQLLIADGLHAGGVSEGGIGLAFSACAVGYIAASAVFVRLGDRAHTRRVNAIVTLLAALALLPALVSRQPAVLVGALLLTAAPRGAINVVAYGLVARGGRTGGSVFGLLNGAWGAATVLAPLAAGALVSTGGTAAAYLATIVPSLAIALALIAGALGPRRSVAAAVTVAARVRG